MRLFLILSIPFTLISILFGWWWLSREKGFPVSLIDLVDRYWYLFIITGMALAGLVVGLEGGYLL